LFFCKVIKSYKPNSELESRDDGPVATKTSPVITRRIRFEKIVNKMTDVYALAMLTREWQVELSKGFALSRTIVFSSVENTFFDHLFFLVAYKKATHLTYYLTLQIQFFHL